MQSTPRIDLPPDHALSVLSRSAPKQPPFERIDCFDESNRTDQPGSQLRLVRQEARRFKEEFRATGSPEYVETFDLAAAPFPTRFGLFRAASSPSPFVTITNRLVVVRWKDRGGARKTLLFEPTDAELAENAPFYADLVRRTPKFLRPLGSTYYGNVEDHLYAIGLDPNEVNYLAFDHLHVQDVRRLVGTRGPAADISPDEPVAPMFPNAKLLVQKGELDLIRELHPLQSRWYQPATFEDLRPEAVLALDGDYLLGPGVALIGTPGHTTGNMSLVLNTDSGIWALSENVIATECLTPEQSKIPGVAKYAKAWDMEVVLNGNTIEQTALQYNSIIKEKSIVDRSKADSRFLQFFPTSELTKNRINPGTAPTFCHQKLSHGSLVRES